MSACSHPFYTVCPACTPGQSGARVVASVPWQSYPPPSPSRPPDCVPALPVPSAPAPAEERFICDSCCLPHPYSQMCGCSVNVVYGEFCRLCHQIDYRGEAYHRQPAECCRDITCQCVP